MPDLENQSPAILDGDAPTMKDDIYHIAVLTICFLYMGTLVLTGHADSGTIDTACTVIGGLFGFRMGVSK